MLVTDGSTLQAGDRLLIASNTNDSVAGTITKDYMERIEAVFSADKNTVTKPDGAAVLTLGGQSGAWTLTNESSKLLGATAVKKMAWDKGTTTWTISIASDGSATIQNTASSYGRILYNVNSPRFLNYTSALSNSMLLPQLYRQSGSGTTTTYYTTGDAAPAAPVVYTVSVTAEQTTITVGEEAYLGATLYADGVAVNGAVPAWTNSKNTVATMETAGNICTVKGVAAGTTQVRATYTLPDGTTKYGYKSITVTGAVRTAAATEAAPAKRGVTPTDIVNGVTGSAIIDGMGSSFSMADFEKYGPKTEVYLAKNQAVVFYLENGKAGQDVQIGAKAVNGTAAGLTVITLKSSSAGGATQTLQKPLATATEMYYEIGADLTWDQGTSCAILVANTGDGVLALTNLRSSAAVRMQINKGITNVAQSIMTRVADGSMVYGADGYVTVVDSSPKPDPIEPTPDPVEPTPDPVEPKPDPVEPTPDPVEPKPDPVEPKPDPVEPTPDPVDPKPMPKFTDLDEGAWYEAGVRYAVEAGLMRGTSETTFEPDGTLTRAMLVTVLYRLAGEPDVKTAHRFTDVPDGCWYSDAVAWAAETGLTNGVSETRFAPDEAVTREQMVTFLWRYAGQPDSKQSLEGFPDAQKVSGYARTALAWAVEHGVIGGNRVGSVNYLDPTEGATRAQIATIFMRSKNLLANE